jgi:hypothetical protein
MKQSLFKRQCIQQRKIATWWRTHVLKRKLKSLSTEICYDLVRVVGKYAAFWTLQQNTNSLLNQPYGITRDKCI